MTGGQLYMAKCAYDLENVDSRRLTRKLVKIDKSPVPIDKRRVSQKSFREVDLGWLTRV